MPPNCGVVSSTTLDIALDVASPATTALLAIFLSPPPDVSTAIKTSSLATVAISDKLATSTELAVVAVVAEAALPL